MGRVIGFLVTLALGLLMPAVIASAQSVGKMPKIAVLFAGVPAVSPQIQGLYDGLRELGYSEGKNITIDFRAAEGRFERLPELAAALVALQPDVIVAATTPSVVATKKQTQTVPIVMVAVGDPVGFKFVASLSQPGGNITGPTLLNTELSAKRVELLKEALPKVSRVAALWNSMNPQSRSALQELHAATTALGVQLDSVAITSPEELSLGLVNIAAMNIDALMVVPDALTYSYRKSIVEFSLKHRIPAFFTYREEVADGGFLGYGVNLREEYQRAAIYVHKILKGAKPADLPVEQPTRFELVVNLKTAQALGLTIPLSLLIQATEVIR